MTQPKLAEKAAKAANAYYKKDFVGAKKILEQLLTLSPPLASLYNQLGNVCTKLSLLSQAENYYRQALTLAPDNINSMYNLALNFQAQHKITDAIAALLAIIEVDSHHVHSHLMLGKLLLEQKLVDKADNYFRHTISITPNDQKLLAYIITLLLQHEAYLHAKFYCQQLIALNPTLDDIHYNLGVIAEQQQDDSTALSYYQKTLAINDKHFAAYNNTGVIYLRQGNTSQAIHYFQCAKQLKPSDEAINYTLAAIGGHSPYTSAPKSYIKSLFNHYASYYDKHLRCDLAYKVPELLQQALIKTANLKAKSPSWQILDLGCGTGLCGKLLKPWAQHLIGVDIAEQMLFIAKEKNSYDQLLAIDIERYLQQSSQSFDVIIAADVLVYFGNLEVIFNLCYQHLTCHGYFAFSLELDQSQPFKLQPSGRFSHSKDYITTLALHHHLKLCHYQQATTRWQRHQKVKGCITILQKT